MSATFGVLPDEEHVIGRRPERDERADHVWVKVEWYVSDESVRVIAFRGWVVEGEAGLSGVLAERPSVEALAQATFDAMGGTL